MGFFSNLGGKIAKGLDILSSTLLEPTTFIKSPTQAGLLVAERRRKIRTAPKGKVNVEALKVVGETLLSTGLAAGALLGAGTAAGRALVVKQVPRIAKKLVPKTLGSALGTIAVSGLLVSSPKARKVAVNLPKTAFSGGQILAKVVETGKAPLGIKQAILTGGLIGGGAVAGAKILGVIKGGTDKKVLTNISQVVPSIMTPELQTVGVAEPRKKAEEVAIKPQMPTINNKITVKPEINVMVKNVRKKFINQQILIPA